MVSRSVQAMGTTFSFIVDADPTTELTAVIDEAVADVARLEARLSRFRPDSELCELNRAGSVEAGNDLLVLTRLAIEAREATGGRFDPTVHAAVLAAGYDRSFDELPGDAPAAPPARAARGGGQVDVDLDRGTVRLGPGVKIDLGGIAKGYAAEVACDRLAPAGPCLVNAGGDIATRGTPGAGYWAVQVPATPEAIVVGVGTGGVATSGRDRRTWRRGGKPLHHIIEPRTGRPAVGDILRVTVFAGSAVRAEVLATALFLASGAEQAFAEAESLDVPAVVVTDGGRTLATPGLA
jgi:thiamine biosynthesis lipoprotein